MRHQAAHPDFVVPDWPCLGGAEGIRTPDLLSAIQARSQLRHSPKRPPVYGAAGGVSNEATTVVIGADDEWRTSGIGVTA